MLMLGRSLGPVFLSLLLSAAKRRSSMDGAMDNDAGKMYERTRKIAFQNEGALNLWMPYLAEQSEHF